MMETNKTATIDKIPKSKKKPKGILTLLDEKLESNEINGYSRIFEMGEQKQSRDFSYNRLIINTKLLLQPKQGIAEVSGNYKRYCFDNFVDFAKKSVKNAASR